MSKSYGQGSHFQNEEINPLMACSLLNQLNNEVEANDFINDDDALLMNDDIDETNELLMC